MDSKVWGRFAGQRVLLLQGPVGPFFARVARALRSAGAESVRKINFNGGDWLFYRRDADNYRGTLDEWPAYLAAYLREHRIDAILLFGDCRPLHRIAVEQAARLTLPCWVFEEGYVRPNYVTFERHGVNGYSELPTDPAFFAGLSGTTPRPEQEVGQTFYDAARLAMLYYTAGTLGKPWFPHRVHHRSLNMLEGAIWWRSFGRKLLFRQRQAPLLPKFETIWSKRYFLVALQTAGDSQVLTHSGFDSVEDFIETVAQSFAENAPADALLVFKHHPLDRGYHHYGALLDRLKGELGLGERLLYVHDLHLPTLLGHARGVVVINSTVGLSALHHETPVITLGKAVYNLQGLTFQGSLTRFWNDAEKHPPDIDLYWKFRAYVVDQTQLNGSFYKPLPGSDSSGLIGQAPSISCWHPPDATVTRSGPASNSVRFALALPAAMAVGVMPMPPTAPHARAEAASSREVVLPTVRPVADYSGPSADATSG